jgi:hypothetical protein
MRYALNLVLPQLDNRQRQYLKAQALALSLKCANRGSTSYQAPQTGFCLPAMLINCIVEKKSAALNAQTFIA